MRQGEVRLHLEGTGDITGSKPVGGVLCRKPGAGEGAIGTIISNTVTAVCGVTWVRNLTTRKVRKCLNHHAVHLKCIQYCMSTVIEKYM